MKKIIGLLFAMVVMIMLFAFSTNAANESDLTFRINLDHESYSVTDCLKSAHGSLIIPSTYNDKPVTTISYSAFEGCTKITNITIPNTVTSIHFSAFEKCTGLTSITIPNSVTTIGNNAFWGCASLKEITIPDSVMDIGYGAFYDTAYYKDDNNWVDEVLYIENHLIKAGREIYSHPTEITGVYTIKEGTKTIAGWAFYGCVNLTGVIIPDSVRNINYGAFEISGLTSIIIPESVTSIGDYAFRGCENLANITIHYGVTKIGTSAFGSTSITSITIPSSVTSIDHSAFDYCSKLKKIIVDVNNTEYSSNDSGAIFNKNKTMLIRCPAGSSNITIPLSVVTIDNHAFSSCNVLTDVYYEGTQAQWVNIINSTDNAQLINVTIHYHEHEYASEIIKQPTHKEEGIKTFTCACGDTYTEPVAKIPHSYNKVVTAPSCTERGYTTYTCSCGDSYVSDYVEAKGHSYTSAVTRPATHLTEGVRTYTCSVCGDSYPEAIAKTKEHSYVILNIVEPTCETEGYTVYVCECGHSYNSDKISATGHNYNGDNCSVCGESKADNCDCNCHKSGFSGLIWKILRFFYKLFGINKTCACGVSHY